MTTQTMERPASVEAEVFNWITENATTNNFAASLLSFMRKRGELSEKQASAVKKNIERGKLREKWDAEKAARREAAEPVPTGRIVLTGTVLCVKQTQYRNARFGEVWKMLLQDDRGFTAWGTIPKSINDERWECSIGKGDRVTFTANIKPSNEDNKHGFFNRPTKGSILPIMAKAA